MSVVLGDGERLPFAARQVLDVRDQMVAEYLQYVALDIVPLSERLCFEVSIAGNRWLQ